MKDHVLLTLRRQTNDDNAGRTIAFVVFTIITLAVLACMFRCYWKGWRAAWKNSRVAEQPPTQLAVVHQPVMVSMATATPVMAVSSSGP